MGLDLKLGIADRLAGGVDGCDREANSITSGHLEREFGLQIEWFDRVDCDRSAAQLAALGKGVRHDGEACHGVIQTELDVRLSILGDLVEEVTAAIRAIKKDANGDDETAADGGKGIQPTGDEDNVTEFKVPDDLTESLNKLTGTNG